MPDVLDQDEVDALLSAVDSGEIEQPTGDVTLEPVDDREVVVYDFKRPERVSKEQLRAVTALHESFARNLGATLSSFMRSIVDVELAGVEQLTYSQFILSLPNPTCFALLTAEPLEGSLILEINPSILFPIIDRLLGGGRAATTIPDRPLTNIEFRLAKKIMDYAIEQLDEMWQHVLPGAAFAIAGTESNPQLVQIVPPNEPVVLVTFEVSMGEVSGVISLCLPYGSIEPVLADLTKRDWFSYRSKKDAPQLKTLVRSNLRRASVNVGAFLARTTISVSELMALSPGDILKTDTGTGAEASLVVNDKLKFRGRAGKFRGKRAVLITRAAETGEEI